MNSFESKISSLQKIFLSCQTKEGIYQTILEWGARLTPLKTELNTPENLVDGCQSKTYVYGFQNEGKCFFQASSDALISAGLAHILCYAYSGETPERILQDKGTFLQDLGLLSSLSLNRSNGLSQMLYHIKKKALQMLTTVLQ